ncbi:MAG: hypothetical protein HQL46_10905 [Gammaproteobacteria bacterium]|nr:hypothetical protein [Gammaproteobacteria bacterium]
MDETAFKLTYREVNHQRCIFEKMILLRYGSCEQAQKLLLAEREAMSCNSQEGQQRCQNFLNLSRQSARFSLQLTKADSPLPHSQELKVQVGSLFGLQQFILHQDTTQTTLLNDDMLKFDPKQTQPINNIYRVISDALKQFDSIGNFPFSEMIKAIMHFKIPTRRRSKKKK